MTAPDLGAWPGLRLVRRLDGGHRNRVWMAADGTQRYAVRHSNRSHSALDWELDLLDELTGQGFRVPVPLPAADGRRRSGSIVVHSWLDGDPPGPDDHEAVACELQRLHALTAERTRRPGFAGTVELTIGAETGGDVDLTAMPAHAVAACRAAWAALDGLVAVVHGDPHPGNVRMLDGRPGFLDWDECRVDRVALDLDNWTVTTPAVHRAVDAWEAAAGWTVEPSYARARLAALLAVGESAPPTA